MHAYEKQPECNKRNTLTLFYRFQIHERNPQPETIGRLQQQRLDQSKRVPTVHRAGIFRLHVFHVERRRRPRFHKVTHVFLLFYPRQRHFLNLARSLLFFRYHSFVDARL